MFTCGEKKTRNWDANLDKVKAIDPVLKFANKVVVEFLKVEGFRNLKSNKDKPSN